MNDSLPVYAMDSDGEILRWVGPAPLSALDVHEIADQRDALAQHLGKLVAEGGPAWEIELYKHLYGERRDRIAAMERMIEHLGARRAWAGHLVVVDELHPATAGA